MVHPDALLRVAWSVIGIGFMVLDLLYLTMSVFGVERSHSLDLVDGIYWTTDILICFRTGIHVNGEVTMNSVSSARAYLRGWFFSMLQ